MIAINQKFLLPAGYLPSLAPYNVFKYYEELRESFAGGGFEYFYMVDQNPEMVNHSPLGGKIVGVHGPWTKLDEASEIESVVLTRLILSRAKVASNPFESARKTLSFAKTVGAKYVVFHTVDLDKNNPEKFAGKLIKESRRLGLKVYLECDIKKPGLEKWYYNTEALWQKFKIPVVFDPATTEFNGENILEEWKKVKNNAGHIHLNEYQPKLNKDQGVMKSPTYARLLRAIKKSGYKGYYTFEVSPLQSQKDKIVAAGFFATALTGLTNVFPKIQEWYARLSQKNLYDSVLFSQKYL